MGRRSYFFLFFSFFMFKLMLVIFLNIYGPWTFGGGNDSDYYDAYALGYDDIAVNVWAVMLRQLNDIGLYNRSAVSAFLMFLGFLIIPLMVANIATGEKKRSFKIFWLVAVCVGFYPTLFYYTLDIYRDIFMVFCFLIGLALVKKFLNTKMPANKCGIALLIAMVSYFLFLLRPYLGVSFIGSFCVLMFYSFRKFPFWISLFTFLAILNLIYAFGLFAPILKYRSMFSTDMEGGSNLGVTFDSASTFLFSFGESFFYQITGFYFSSTSSQMVFLAESLPFLSAFIYLIINRKYSNSLVDFLVLFFVIYSTIWLLGNDNLGTAVRLRMYNYISVLIAAVVVYLEKNGCRNHSIREKI